MTTKKASIFSKSVVASIFGNSLEWYDFVLYGSLASFIGAHFFPATSKMASLMMTFAVFAIGFFMRPLGGFFFGHFGDTQGRRKPLLWSVALMAIPTVILGLVPSYDTIGIAAPILIVAVRLFQGLAVGGEYTGSIVYLGEISDRHDRGFFSSFATFGIFVGIIFGPIVVRATNYFVTPVEFHEWAWRIPFLFSVVPSIIIFLLRRKMSESVVFSSTKKKHDLVRTPFKECLLKHKRELLLCFFISAQVGIPFWLVMVYSVTYFTKVLDIPFLTVETQNFFTILIALLSAPLFGLLTRKINARLMLLVITACFIFLSYFMNIEMLVHVGGLQFYLAHFFVTLLASAYLAVFAGYITSLFPPELRYSGISVAYNVSLALFGGTAPLIVTALIAHNILPAPGVVLTVGGVMAFVALLFSKRFAQY